MTVPREPGDPARGGWSEDDRLLHASMANEIPPRPSDRDDLEGPLQADPEMAEMPAGPGRIAIYAVAALLVVFAVLYGMTQNNTSPTNTASTPPAAHTAANAPASPPARNATPGPNAQPGTTTGAAPGHPAQPPAPAAPSAAGPGATTR